MQNGIRTIVGSVFTLYLLAVCASVAGSNGHTAELTRMRLSNCAGILVLTATFLLSVLALYKLVLIFRKTRMDGAEEGEMEGESSWHYYIMGFFAATVFALVMFEILKYFEELFRVLQAD